MVVFNVRLLPRTVGIAKETEVSFVPFKSFSKADTLPNSPPLSVSKTGKISEKEKPAEVNVYFNCVIRSAPSAADLLSMRIPNMKSTLTNWNVMITFPPILPITVSISESRALSRKVCKIF